MKERLDIGIAGGGIAGIAAALALANQAKTITIIERSSHFSETGAGLQLGPNAIRALRHLQVWDTIEPMCVAPPALHLRDGQSGRLLQTINFDREFEERYGAPYRIIHRADLHRKLREAANQKPNLSIRMGESQTTIHTFDVLFAADGVNSNLRREMFFAPAVHHPIAHYRAFAPPPAEPDIDHRCVTLWMMPGAHVVHYPMRDGQLNLVAAVRQTNLVEGWEALTDGLTVRQNFTKAAAPLQQILVQAQDWTGWSSFSAPALQQWHQGNICLLGDAAHAMLPYLAQGAAQALEDAAILSECWHTSNNVVSAFRTFQQQRQKRAENIALASARQGVIYHASGSQRLIRNVVLENMPKALLFRRLDMIYKPRQPVQRIDNKET